jgi:polyisoprenoid-binding protein YceI
MSTLPSPSIPTTGTWAIDSVHSSATFTVAHHVIATFRGHFHDISGELVDGVLSGSVQTDSIDLGSVALFKEHLLGADWFDIANHPSLSFRSTDLHAHGDHIHAVGELTIKGVTKPVAIAGSVRGPVPVPNHDGSSSDRLGIDLTTTVNRQEFGITGGGGASDEVTIEVSLELVAQ